MITIRELDYWDEFEQIVKQEIISEIAYDSPKYTVFRGQPNSEWYLKTSLERMIGENMLAPNYFRLIESIQDKIETFTNQRWNLPDYEEFQKHIEEHHKIDEQTFFYMTYLRHFGFPTPLLDWSRSPFVAAYFAFRDVANPASKIAIYMCSLSSSESFGIHTFDYPSISPIIKSPRNNKRHELQQGVYTVCLREESENIYFSYHEDGGQNGHYPFITKFILPSSERVNAFRALQIYNINPYSLFGTEESLLESLFLERYKFALLNKTVLEERARQYPNIDRYNIDVNDVNNIW